MDEQTSSDLTPEQVEFVEKARTARSNARRDARSGNPAKRAAAESVVRAATGIIRAVNARARQASS